MKLNVPSIAAALFLCSTFALGGCAAPNRLVSQWSLPGYAAPSFRKVLVGASGGETAVRRNLEDEFVAQLGAAGVEAVPSYRYIPEDPKIDEAKVRKAAEEAGAQAAILIRSLGMERETEHRYHPYPAFGIFGPHFGASWSIFYGPGSVRRYDVYASEVTLYDVRRAEVVWTGTLKTTDPDDIAAATKHYVETIIEALREKQLLGIRSGK